MVPKTERLELRLDPELMSRLDIWIAKHSAGSRSEAVRRIVEDRLASATGPSFMPSNIEKLILHLLAEIKQGQNGEDKSAEFIKQAILGGHFWALELEMPGILHDHVDSRQSVAEVMDILDTWDAIERAYSKFSLEEKAEVGRWAGREMEDPVFEGFDGNNEGEHFGIANFLVNKMDRFHRFKSRTLNSHRRVLAGYLDMARMFQPMRAKLSRHGLTAQQVGQLLRHD